MPYPLHKPPQGFLTLLGLQTLGKQPDLVSEQLVPVVDLTDNYLLEGQSTGTSSGAAGALNAGHLSTIPFGPVRYLAITAGVVMGAAGGNTLTLAVGVRRPTLGVAWLNMQEFTEPIAGATYTCTALLSFPMILPAGWILVCQPNGDAAGVDHVPFISEMVQPLFRRA